MRTLRSLASVTAAIALASSSIALAAAVHATELPGSVTSPPTITYPDGSTAVMSASGSISLGNTTKCMNNPGSGSCNWGSSSSPVDFAGVYSLDSVKDAQGIRVSFGASAIDAACIPYTTLDGSNKVVAGVVTDCNNGNSVGTTTVTFSQPVTSATLHIHNIGGSSGSNWAWNGAHTWDEWQSFWPAFTLQTPGISMTPVSTRGNISVAGSTITTLQPVGTGLNFRSDWGQVWAYPLPYAGYTITGVSDTSNRYTMGSGSVQFTSPTPFTSLTFDVTYQYKMLDYPPGFSPLGRADLYIGGDPTHFLWSIADRSTPLEWTLSYDANGGTCTAPAQTGPDQSTVTVHSASVCSRPGYKFIGWNTEANGSGSNTDPDSNWTLIADDWLYAMWEPESDTAPTTPSKSKQLVPSSVMLPTNAVFNKALDASQKYVVLPRATKTNAGKPIRATARCVERNTLLPRGDVQLCQVVRGKNGKVTLRVAPGRSLRVTLRLTAPGDATHYPLANVKTYSIA